MTATIDPLLITAPHRPAARRTAQATSAGRQMATHLAASKAVYRRRRMVVVASVVFGLASAVLVTGAFATEPSTSNLRSIPRTYVVESGDTLWSIARAYMPTGNISGFVDELARMNGVDLEVGQVIRIP